MLSGRCVPVASKDEDPRCEIITKHVFLVQGGRMFYSSSLLNLLFACCLPDSSLISPGLVPGIYRSMVTHERKRKCPTFWKKCVYSPQQHFDLTPSCKNCSKAKLRRGRQVFAILASLTACSPEVSCRCWTSG